MKKPLSLSILSVCWLIGSLVPNFASATSSEEYWTLEEMQKLNTEVQAEIKTACADTDDFMCADSYLWSKADSDPIYRALMNYRAEYLMLTAFNPERETLKLFYDTQSIPAWESSDPTLSDLYIAQFEKGYFEGGFYIFLERGQEVLGTNILLNKRKSLDDSDWLPFYTEVEFDAPGLSAASSMRPEILLFYRTVSNVSYVLQFNIQSCLTSPDYQPGMECRAVFGASRTFYLPFAVETGPESESETETEVETKTETELEPEESESPESEPELESETSETEPESPVAEPTTEPNTEESDNSSASEIAENTEVERAAETTTTTDAETMQSTPPSTASSTTQVAALQTDALVSTNQPVLAANTTTTNTTDEADETDANDATATSLHANNTADLPQLGGNCERGSTFPWWFIILVVACDAVIMWFFWPKREKTPKIAKKS